MDITRLVKSGAVGVHSQEEIGKRPAVVQRVPDDVVMEDLSSGEVGTRAKGGGDSSSSSSSIDDDMISHSKIFFPPSSLLLLLLLLLLRLGPHQSMFFFSHKTSKGC